MTSTVCRPRSITAHAALRSCMWMLAAAGSALAGEQGARLSDRAAEAMVANAAQGDGVRLTPEVSAVHSRLAPSDAAPLAADGRPLSELAGINYRLWMGRGRTEFGVGVGTLGYVHHGVEARTDSATALHRATPTVSLGIRYNVTPESAVFADASGARGLGLDSSAAYVNTKLGVEWKPAKSRLGFDHGALGVHFDSGYRLSLRARSGGVRIVLRGEF